MYKDNYRLSNKYLKRCSISLIILNKVISFLPPSPAKLMPDHVLHRILKNWEKVATKSEE